jgi:hypothetical protein
METNKEVGMIVFSKTGMRRVVLTTLLVLLVLALGAGPAVAQSGHFVGTPTCTDTGTQVECSGKVAGLGGTTFEIIIEADGIASVECTNPGENVAPGQDTAVTVEGTTEPQPTPRNGQYRFTVSTDDPEPLPPKPTCPNNQWTPDIVDVTFTTATLTLFEDGQSDQITVPVS